MSSNSCGSVSRPTTRTGHVSRWEIASGQLLRIEPHAHRIFARTEVHYVAHARHALERVYDIHVKVIRNELAGVASVERIKSRAENKVEVRLRDVEARRNNFSR